MFLIQKYTQYKAAQAEQQRRKVTEKELSQLNHKIDKLLTKLDEHEPEIACSQDEECVVCVHAKATMQTYPCGHRVVCRKCFVKTIQMAVANRLLPLRCVICRAKILRLKHFNLPMSGSASQYNLGSHHHQMPWYQVPQSASLYSVTSNISATSGVSSASSCSSSSSYKACASAFSSASFKKRPYSGSYTTYNRMGYKPLRSSPTCLPASTSHSGISLAKKDNKIVPVEEGPTQSSRGKITLIQEFQREFRNGKEGVAPERPPTGNYQKLKARSASYSETGGSSSRIKCANLLVSQAQSSWSSAGGPEKSNGKDEIPITSSCSSSSSLSNSSFGSHLNSTLTQPRGSQEHRNFKKLAQFSSKVVKKKDAKSTPATSSETNSGDMKIKGSSNIIARVSISAKGTGSSKTITDGAEPNHTTKSSTSNSPNKDQVLGKNETKNDTESSSADKSSLSLVRDCSNTASSSAKNDSVTNSSNVTRKKEHKISFPFSRSISSDDKEKKKSRFASIKR